MRIDPMMAALNLVTPPEGAVPEEVQALLVDHLETFLRGGGSISWPEWCNLSDEARVALAEAGDRIRAEEGAEVAESLVALLEGTIQRAEVELAAEKAAGVKP